MSQIISTDLSDCYLRFAEEKDVPLILDFIRRLAEYEKISGQVVATAEQLRVTITSPATKTAPQDSYLIIELFMGKRSLISSETAVFSVR